MSLADLVEPPRPVKARTPSRRHELRDDPDGRTTPEFKAKLAARMKALNADPEFKAKLSKAASARMKALHADPEFKAKVAARMKALHADPEFKAKFAATKLARKKKRMAIKIAELQAELKSLEGD